MCELWHSASAARRRMSGMRHSRVLREAQVTRGSSGCRDCVRRSVGSACELGESAGVSPVGVQAVRDHQGAHRGSHDPDRWDESIHIRHQARESRSSGVAPSARRIGHGVPAAPGQAQVPDSRTHEGEHVLLDVRVLSACIGASTDGRSRSASWSRSTSTRWDTSRCSGDSEWQRAHRSSFRVWAHW
jgi:hypothetical protein